MGGAQAPRTPQPPRYALDRGFSINLPAFYHECCSLIGHSTHYLFCFSKNRPAFYHECRSLIGYAIQYLFCCRLIVVVVNKMAAASSRLQSVFSVSEGNLSNFVVLF